jgi:hypothetical protein
MYRQILVGLRRMASLDAPAGFTTIERDTIVEAGLDPLDVFGWVKERGGYEAVAYIRSSAHEAGSYACRPPLHPTTYYAIPLAALEPSDEPLSAG